MEQEVGVGVLGDLTQGSFERAGAVLALCGSVQEHRESQEQNSV